MIGRQQTFHIDRTQQQLVPIHPLQTRGGTFSRRFRHGRRALLPQVDIGKHHGLRLIHVHDWTSVPGPPGAA